MSIAIRTAPPSRIHFEDAEDEWTSGGGLLFLMVLFGFWLTKLPLLPGWAMATRARAPREEQRG